MTRKAKTPGHTFTKVVFQRFKAFESFQLNLRRFNVLVGPNNAGKSTILTAFRILSAGLRKARQRRPEMLPSSGGKRLGYVIGLEGISIGEDNIFFNYDDSVPASVTFTLSNKNQLILHFPSHGVCYLFAEDPVKTIDSTTLFKARFDCSVGFVPILGPVEHLERPYKKEAARLALLNYTAARNFRNIWFHYEEHFEEFRHTVSDTWPGMDVQPPKIERVEGTNYLRMYCLEQRIPREICWAGFGFQVWCQMITHVVKSADCSVFLIDEPDIYLHSDLQRQLLSLLRNLGPDIVIATHSTEIVTEAEVGEIVIVDKAKRRARRIRDPGELGAVFSMLGSNLNPILTQLARTRRAVFVEGKDFQVLSKFARKLGRSGVSTRVGFSVIPVEGFSVDRIRTLKKGIETTLGGKINAAAVLDRDYRSAVECKKIESECEKMCDLVQVHSAKEVENFLLVPRAIDRAAASRVSDRAHRSGGDAVYDGDAQAILLAYANEKKSQVMSQFIECRKKFVRKQGGGEDASTITEAAVREFEALWSDPGQRLKMIAGKEALAKINQYLQSNFNVSVTPTGIIDAMDVGEVPTDVVELCQQIEAFSKG